MTNIIPARFKPYFWDVEVKKLDPAKNPFFVIQRLLDKGDKTAVNWVRENYGDSKIKETFSRMKDFSPRIANFWRLFLNIPISKILCLQEPYLSMRKSHWPF